MGAGKSVAARELGKRLNRKVVSTDELVERKEGRSIAQIFQESGEAYFRRCEKDVVWEIAQKKDLIIDCGGGIFLDSDNVANLKRNGIVIYLLATPEVLFERTQGRKHRPLLNVADPHQKIKELLAIREPAYRQAHHVIDTSNKKNHQVCDEILALIES